MNKEGAGGKEEEAEKEGTCLPAIPVCSALQKPVTGQVGSTALSRDAQVLLSLVEAGLVPSVRDRVEKEHKLLNMVSGCPSRAGAFSWSLVNPIHWQSTHLLLSWLCCECCCLLRLDRTHTPFAELHSKDTMDPLCRESLTYQAGPPALIQKVWLHTVTSVC